MGYTVGGGGGFSVLFQPAGPYRKAGSEVHHARIKSDGRQDGIPMGKSVQLAAEKLPGSISSASAAPCRIHTT